jgi:hypothetical protein
MSLTGNVSRKRRTGAAINVLLAAGEEVFTGSLVTKDNTTGFAKGASLADGGVVIGVAKEHVKNTGANGDQKVDCERGIYQFGVNGTALKIGDTAYAYDDDTVTAAATTAQGETNVPNSPVGKVFDVDSDGSVWVDLR